MDTNAIIKKIWMLSTGAARKNINLREMIQRIRENDEEIDQLVSESLDKCAERKTAPEEIMYLIDFSKSIICSRLLIQANMNKDFDHIFIPPSAFRLEDYFRYISRDTAVVNFYMENSGAVWAMMAIDNGTPSPTYSLMPVIYREDGAEFKKKLSQCTSINGIPHYEIMNEVLEWFANALFFFLFAFRKPKKLVWIPHKLLHLLPLHAMAFKDEEGEIYIDDYIPRVTYASCIPELKFSNVRRSDTESDNNTFRIVAVLDSSSGLNWLKTEELNFQAIKASIISGVEVVILKGSDTFGELFFDGNIINWSSHAKAIYEGWGNSYLIFNGKRITARDIVQNWRFRNRPVVILSGCATSSGTHDKVEEYCGLDLAFKMAGARAVYSTVWPVDDRLASFASMILTTWLSQHNASPEYALTLFQKCLRQGRWSEFMLTEAQLKGIPKARRNAVMEIQEPFKALHRDTFSTLPRWAAFKCLGA